MLQTANSVAPTEQSATFTQPAATPTSPAGPPAVSGLDGYSQTLLSNGISEQTAELPHSQSWGRGTAAAYKSAWKQRSSWCGQRKIDPFCSSLATIADYLTELLNKGESYRIISNHVSAISAFHTPICDIRVGQQELICKVVGACFNREFKIRRLRTTATDKHDTAHDQNHVTAHFSRVALRLRWVVELFRVVGTTENILLVFCRLGNSRISSFRKKVALSEREAKYVSCV